MPRLVLCVLLAALAFDATADAQQRRRTPARRAPPKPAPEPTPATPIVQAALVNCPQVLGEGVRTKRLFCEVPIGREPTAGVLITLPPHTGDVTLRFDLHNRHTYSEELAKTNRGFRQYTATIGVLTADNTLLSRAIVMSEFRTAADLVDRVSGGAGPGGVKAVAPTGTEAISITIPAEEQSVSLLGEKLIEQRIDGVDTFTAMGRPIAVVSNLLVEYVPAQPEPATTTKPPAKPAPAKPATTAPKR
jgi:hypothetical protein